MLIEGSCKPGEDDFHQLLGHVASPHECEGNAPAIPVSTGLEKILPCNLALRKKSAAGKGKFTPKRGGFFRAWNSGCGLVLGAMFKLYGSGSMQRYQPR